MFISNSTIQSSVWGWTNKALDLTGVANSSVAYGEFTGYTVADDGYAYAIPLNPAGATLVNKVMVLSPGTCNTRYSDYTQPSGSFVTADGGPTKPNFTAGAQIISSKGILAPNGKIYYARLDATGLCILTPNNGDCTWEFYTFTNSVPGGGVPIGTSISGMILGKDGKLYLIPGNPAHNAPVYYYVSKLLRLDISGPSIVEELSAFYDGAGGSTLRNPVALSSSGTSIQLSAASSMGGITVGMQVSVSDNDDTKGVLNQDYDTTITAVNTITKVITVDYPPAVPLSSKPLLIGAFSKKPTNTYSTLTSGQYRGRMNNYFEKSFISTDYASSNSVNYNTIRNPQANALSLSNESGTNPLYTAFLDPNPSSNKIYIFPHAGTQIWWLDPDNWDNRFAFHTSKNLSLTNLTIGNPGTVIPYGKSSLYTGNALKKISSVALGGDDKFYVTLGQFNTIAPTPLNLNVRKLMVIDTINNSVSFVTANDAVNEGSIYAQSGLNQLPNGAFFSFNTKSITGLDAYKGFQEIFIDSSGNAKFYKNINNTVYGKGPFYPRGNYEQNIPGDPQENIVSSPGFRQPSGITFGSSLDKNGKIIIPGNRLRYGLEYLSVKGFYDDDVTNFKLIDTTYLDIPEDLADLPTSKYNIRNNMPL